MIYERRASPLHAARASIAALWCVALACVGLTSTHPLALGAVLVATLAAGSFAGVGEQIRRAARAGLLLGLLFALINPLVSREGLTVIARLGDWGPLGQADVTLEATVYGLLFGARTLCLILVAGLYATCVDPDEILRGLRRFGFRSALTASLATRLVPVLARDGRRLAEAQRCRPRPGGRTLVVRATAAGALERAMDVAATLEVRGFGAGRRPPAARRPLSRHDLAFLASALGLIAVAVAGPLSGVLRFDAYPRLDAAGGTGPFVLAVAAVVTALAPFADRRGIVP